MDRPLELIRPAILRQLRAAPTLLEELEQRADVGELALQQQLRRDYPAELVRAALTLRELRRKAAGKFSRATQMWFDRVGLEQSTAEAVARHKARRFFEAGEKRVGDLCCGIGADSIALAEQVCVLSWDVQESRCLMTGWNADVYGVGERIQPVCADVEQLARFPPLVHIDPDQRTRGGQRSRRVERMRPGLAFVRHLQEETRGGAVKLSPAANFAGAFRGVEFELVSLHGECRECTVWFGELGQAGVWRATVLPAGETLSGNPLDAVASLSPLRRYVYDPDPAVVRAGLVDLLAERLGLCRLDAAEEYLTSEEAVSSPFVSVFEVRDVLPNNERAIRQYFRRSDFGEVEIKCRRIPVAVEKFRRRLELSGSQGGVLLFVRTEDKARAVVARRLPAGQSAPHMRSQV